MNGMKHSKHHDHARNPGPRLEPVRFEFTDPTATTVCVAGSFNHWRPDAKPLHPVGDGRWLKDTVLSAGTYEYCLVVDGQWRPDPQAKETVPNPFGGRNSLLRVAPSPEVSLPANTEPVPLSNTPPGEETECYEQTHTSR